MVLKHPTVFIGFATRRKVVFSVGVVLYSIPCFLRTSDIQGRFRHSWPIAQISAICTFSITLLNLHHCVFIRIHRGAQHLYLKVMLCPFGLLLYYFSGEGIKRSFRLLRGEHTNIRIKRRCRVAEISD
jgi:hypothetical protein